MFAARPVGVVPHWLFMIAALGMLAGCNNPSAPPDESGNDSLPAPAAGTGNGGDIQTAHDHPPAGNGTAANGHGVEPNAPTTGTAPKKKPLEYLTWPKPSLAVMLSGEQLGHFEPCGCTAGQLGGLARRADLARRLRDQQWPLTGFDLGGIVRRNRRQSEIKFETMLAALFDMDYQAIGLGPQELRLGPEYLLSQHITDPEDPSSSLWFVAANVVFYDTPDLGTPQSWKVVKVNGQKVGVTAIIGRRLAETELLQRSNSDVRVGDPRAALPAVVEKLREQRTALNVLLAHTDLDDARKLAEEFPQFDVVVSAGGPEDPDGKPEYIGKTLVVTVGHKGKYTGLVGFYPDQEPRLRYELVALEGDRFDDNAKMVEHMRFYQQRLIDERIVAIEPPIAHPSGAQFVGAEKCGECHTTAMEIWKNTPHAHAFESLDPKHERHGYERLRGINRTFDAECITCHVAGWEPQQVLRYRSGFINAEFAETEQERAAAKLLKGTQCENCHGPGSEHVKMIDEYYSTDDGNLLAAARKEVRVTLAEAKKNVCYKCHDLDNSPHFEFDAYWEKVKHYGVD